jgi:hypothetical protein
MKIRTPLLILGVAIAALPSIMSCVVPPPPGAVYVRVGPPAPLVEVQGVAPGPEFVWIRGYHRWEGERYVWVAGRWERRPHASAVWVHGEWRHHRNGWYWVEGHWR